MLSKWIDHIFFSSCGHCSLFAWICLAAPSPCEVQMAKLQLPCRQALCEEVWCGATFCVQYFQSDPAHVEPPWDFLWLQAGTKNLPVNVYQTIFSDAAHVLIAMQWAGAELHFLKQDLVALLHCSLPSPSPTFQRDTFPKDFRGCILTKSPISLGRCARLIDSEIARKMKGSVADTGHVT